MISAALLIRNMKHVASLTPYLFLSLYFGMSFVIPPGSNADSTRYAAELKNLYEKDVPFDTYFSQLYSEESSQIDVYQPLITWIVSKFTGEHQILFGIYAIVFGYFWFNSLRLARSLLPDHLNNFHLLLLLFFAFINPIWYINGVRMWTAVGMFFYGILLLHFVNNKLGYFFIILPLFFHFSLSIVIALYIAYQLLPKTNLTILYGIYLLTFFVGELDLEVVRMYYDLLPDFMQSRQGYLSDEDTNEIQFLNEQKSIHIILLADIVKYLSISLLSWMFFSMFLKKTMFNTMFTQFFALAIVFSAFSNLVRNISSGGRFTVLSDSLVIFCFIWFLSREINGYIPKNFRHLGTLLLLFAVVVQIRIGTDYVGLFFLIGNPVVNFFNQDTTPIIDYVKSIL